MDKEEALQLINKNGWNLDRIPIELKDYALCKAAAKNVFPRVGHNESILCYVPTHLIDKDLCRLVLSRDGEALRDIPMEMRDRELCLLAVQVFGHALIDVPKHLRDKEICECAVREDGSAFASVPEHLQSEELAYWSVISSPQHLSMIPERFRSERVYLRAMRWESHKVRKLIPDKMFSKLYCGH